MKVSILSPIFILLTFACAQQPDSNLQSETPANQVSSAAAQQKLDAPSQLAVRKALAAALSSASFSHLDLISNHLQIEGLKHLSPAQQEQSIAINIRSAGPSDTVSAAYVVTLRREGASTKIGSVREASTAEADHIFGPSDFLTQGARSDDKQSVVK
jgi:hypothetical protein